MPTTRAGARIFDLDLALKVLSALDGILVGKTAGREEVLCRPPCPCEHMTWCYVKAQKVAWDSTF